MKKIVTLIVLLVNFYAYTQWYVNNPTNQNLYTVYFANANTGWIGGANGTIMKTTNGGVSWTVQSIQSTSTTVFCVRFINETLGFLSTGNGRIYKTTNGGLDWVDKYYAASTPLLDIYFTDASNGTVVGGPTMGDAVYLKTADGGETWTPHTVTESQFNSVYFLTSSVGFITSANGDIIKTDNNGQNWNQVFSNSSGTVFTLQFVNSLTGLASGPYSTFIKTYNGGATWTSSRINPMPESSIYGLYFLSESKGWVACQGGYICKTTDGGATWTQMTSNISTTLNDIFFADSSTGFAVGRNGVLLSTKNLTSVEEGDLTLFKYDLLQNYPNPFNPETYIKFSIPDGNNVKLSVYNSLGQKVKELVNGYKEAGSYEVKFSGKELASGMYIYKLDAVSKDGKKNFSSSKKMLLVK
jgi:photosystem II stability/assembly factor-like uncharacterized protein